ncbi:hypothetical protein Bhyg_12648, partial [Pseudolycoriella hygida]
MQVLVLRCNREELSSFNSLTCCLGSDTRVSVFVINTNRFELFNMSSPSPHQSVKPPSRKQRKASPQPSTSSAFVRKALGKKVVSTSQPRRTVTKRPI